MSSRVAEPGELRLETGRGGGFVRLWGVPCHAEHGVSASWGTCPAGLLHRDCPSSTARVQVEAVQDLIATCRTLTVPSGSWPFLAVSSRAKRRPPDTPVRVRAKGMWPAPGRHSLARGPNGCSV